MIRIFLYIYYKKHLVQEGRKENSKRFSLLLTSGTVIEEGVSPKRFIPARCTLLFSKHRVCVFQRRRKPRVAKEGGWIDVCPGCRAISHAVACLIREKSRLLSWNVFSSPPFFLFPLLPFLSRAISAPNSPTPSFSPILCSSPPPIPSHVSFKFRPNTFCVNSSVFSSRQVTFSILHLQYLISPSYYP